MFIFILLMLSIFPPMTADIQVPAFPNMMTELHTTGGLVKLVLALFGIGYAVGQLFYGPLSDRFGRFPVLIWGLIFFCITTFICAISDNIHMLLIVRVFQAMASGVGANIAYAMVRDTYEKTQAAKHIALIAASVGFSLIIAPIIGGYLTTWFGWRSTFYFLLIFGVLLTFLSYYGLSETNKKLDHHALKVVKMIKNYFSVLRHRQYLGYNLTAAFLVCTYYAYFTDSSIIIINHLGFKVSTYGYFLGINAVGYLCGSLASRFMMKRFSLNKIIGYGLSLAVIAGLTILLRNTFLGENIYWIVIPMTIITFCNAVTRPVNIACGLSVLKRNIGIGSTLIGFSQYFFAGMTGFMLSYLHSSSSVPMTLTIFLATFLSLGTFCIMRPWR